MASNVQMISVDNIKQKMMKILCIALLLAITLQIQLTHEQNNFFKRDKRFKVIFNIDKSRTINSAKFNFTQDKVTFEAGCGRDTTFYEIRANNVIKFARNRWVHVNGTSCEISKNSRIRELLNNTRTFNYGNPNVDFLDANSTILLTLQKI